MEGNETTYGLRHVPTGRIMRLDVIGNRDYAGDEGAVTLTTKPSCPPFEVEGVLDVIVVLTRDQKWFNSSRERPGWGGFAPEELEIVRFDRAYAYDGPEGSDPVVETRTVSPEPFVGFAPVSRLASSRVLPPALTKRYFGVDLEVEDREWTEAAILAPDVGVEIEEAVGMYVRGGGSGNTGRIVAVADLPDDYPVGCEARRRLENGDRLAIALVDLSPDSRIPPRPSVAPPVHGF